MAAVVDSSNRWYHPHAQRGGAIDYMGPMPGLCRGIDQGKYCSRHNLALLFPESLALG